MNFHEFKISVITPVFNAEDFIEKSILSALKQPQVAEVIVINDGSTDNTPSILNKLSKKDFRIKLMSHENSQNKGRSASRNLGIKNSNYDFIAFLDADDVFLENRFRNEEQIFFYNPDIDGVYNAIGAKFYRKSMLEEEEKFSLTTVNDKIRPENLFSRISPMGNSGHFSGDGLTVKKKVFDEVGYFNEELEVAEDTHMWLKLTLKCKLLGGSLEKPVALRGIHEKNVSTSYGDLKYLQNYNKMWHLLLRWSLKNHINQQSIYNIWKKAIISDLKIRNKFFSKSSYLIRFTVLLKKHPKLITIKKIWKNFPFPFNIPELKNQKPSINILTRTSGRPNGYKELNTSIQIQNYPKLRHLVSYDQKEDLQYLEHYKAEKIKVSPILDPKADPEEYKPYNLYCNTLLEQVQQGWIFILDDDNKLYDPKSLKILAKEISKADEDTMLIFQTAYPNGSKIPEDIYFKKQSIEKFHIDTACVVFHSKYKSVAKWDSWRTADYRFIRDLAKAIPKQKWIKRPLTYKFNFGDLGRRNDIY